MNAVYSFDANGHELSELNLSFVLIRVSFV